MTDQALNKIIEAAASRKLQLVAADNDKSGPHISERDGWIQDLAANTKAGWVTLIFECQATRQVVFIEYSPADENRAQPRAYTRYDAIDERLDGGAIIAEADRFGRRMM